MSGKNVKNNKHHVEPKSRIVKKCKKNRKKVKVPKNFHDSWNIIFDNLYCEELIPYVEKINWLMEVKKEITWNDINKIRNEIKDLNLNEENRENKIVVFLKSQFSGFNEKVNIY